MLGDEVLHGALFNTLWWTAGSLFFQFFLGLGLALLLNRPFHGRKLVQGLVFLPWAVPTFLTGLTWTWLFNPVIGPLPHVFHAIGLQAEPVTILADPATAMWGPIIANVWFGIPFFAITLLAARKSIPAELYEAAAIDGASAWQQFTKVTLPFLAPTIAITVMLRTVWIATFADLIYVMTAGGPAGSTNTIATYIYVSAFRALDKGYASADRRAASRPPHRLCADRHSDTAHAHEGYLKWWAAPHCNGCWATSGSMARCSCMWPSRCCRSTGQ